MGSFGGALHIEAASFVGLEQCQEACDEAIGRVIRQQDACLSQPRVVRRLESVAEAGGSSFPDGLGAGDPSPMECERATSGPGLDDASFLGIHEG